ncbi:hypothetical protein P3S67_010977 [Capsicum chacoense]
MKIVVATTESMPCFSLASVQITCLYCKIFTDQMDHSNSTNRKDHQRGDNSFMIPAEKTSKWKDQECYIFQELH